MQTWQGKSITVNILYSRAGIAQQIWLSNDNGAILIDTGDGSLRDILTSNFDFSTLKGIIFTHGHFDHVGGLYPILGFLRMIGHKKLLQIYMPKGCQEVYVVLDSFKKAYSDSTPFKISLREIEPRESFKIASMTIEPYPVVHCGSTKDGDILDPIPALGYRISYKGEILAISGDTGLCPSLKGLVNDADLAIIEATMENSKQVSKDLLNKVHLSEDIAKELGKLAKDFILIHKGQRK